MTETNAFAPLDLYDDEDEPGTYTLVLDDSDMLDSLDTFESLGFYGNGYGWEGVARSAIMMYANDLEDVIEFDSEAGGFVAYSEDLGGLQRLAGFLQRALFDQDFLANLIRNADPDWLD